MLVYIWIIICMTKFDKKYITTIRTLPVNLKPKDLQLFEEELLKIFPMPNLSKVKKVYVANYTLMRIFPP